MGARRAGRGSSVGCGVLSRRTLQGLSEHGGLLGYYRSEQYRDFVPGGRFLVALVILTLVSFLINFVPRA